MFWKKKKEPFKGPIKLKPLKYSPKILVAWGEAISGNTAIRDWFLANEDYKELGVFVHALNLDDSSRDWLLNEGFAHLMAMINAVEGNKEALHWLEVNNMQVLKMVALSGDRDDDAYEWLRRNGHLEFAMISLKIRRVKDDIEEKHNDVHKIS